MVKLGQVSRGSCCSLSGWGQDCLGVPMASPSPWFHWALVSSLKTRWREAPSPSHCTLGLWWEWQRGSFKSLTQLWGPSTHHVKSSTTSQLNGSTVWSCRVFFCPLSVSFSPRWLCVCSYLLISIPAFCWGGWLNPCVTPTLISCLIYHTLGVLFWTTFSFFMIWTSWESSAL